MERKSKKGKVYWLTGLSGAGKTTIGKALQAAYIRQEKPVLFLDGDELRNVFGNDLGYTREDRLKCAMRYSRLCKMLSEQGVDVICCTISMFHQVRRWNRDNIGNYIEVYIRVPIELLKERNQKGLYSGIADGSSEDVVGMDLNLELPERPELVIDNLGDRRPEVIAEMIQTKAKEIFGE